MVTIKNITTGKSYNVHNVKLDEVGHIVSEDATPKGERFVKKWEELGVLCELHNEKGEQYFIVGAECELEKTTRAKAKQTPKDAPKDAPKAKDGEKDETPEKAAKKAKAKAKDAPAAVIETPTNEKDETPKTDDDAQQLLSLLGRVAGRGASVDAEQVRDIIRDELARLAKDEPAKVAALAKRAKANDDEGEVFCADFDDICADVADGYNVYLYGAAGCGKSHTAEQVARRLGLNYYECMQMEFAHDVKGYGDAQGRYVETALYKAMTDPKGALLFLDEFDRSNSQVTTVLNAVMEARRFDFPVVGMVQADPKFRIMAAGNTTMTGLNDEYVAANVIDASTRNRFTMYEAKYDRRVELPIIAKGDAELVDFMEDVRQSIAGANVQLIASYRNTKYLHAHKDNKEAALRRSLFAGVEADTMRTIYGGLKNRDNVWAKALKNVAK